MKKIDQLCNEEDRPIMRLARDVPPYDPDHVAQHCPTAVGWMYPNASMVGGTLVI